MSAKSMRRAAYSLVRALSKSGVDVPLSVMLHALAACNGRTNWHVLLDQEQREDRKPGSALRSADIAYVRELLQTEAALDGQSRHLRRTMPQGLLERWNRTTPSPVDLLEALQAVTYSLKNWMEIADEEDKRDYDKAALQRAEALLSGQPLISPGALEDLLAAAHLVIDRWESGDLAEAVRELDALVSEIESLHSEAHEEGGTEQSAAEESRVVDCCDRCKTPFDADNPGTETGRCVCGAMVLPKYTPKIPGEVRSDDREFVAAFNAAEYFAAASDEKLAAMSRADFKPGSVMDEVAYWFETRSPSVRRVLSYVSFCTQEGREMGFEVVIEPQAARRWLEIHRPALVPSA